MAARAGFGGIVTLSGLTVGVKTWIVNTVADALETTTLADNQNRQFIAGLKSFTGSMEANWDVANTVAVGDIGLATFQFGSDTDSVSASILLTGIDTENAFDGVVSAGITFQGTGAQPA
ncbi:MAG: hypothetical protein ACYTBX_17425 [Planctomycetota bacterium]|jgi:hypothetical protein